MEDQKVYRYFEWVRNASSAKKFVVGKIYREDEGDGDTSEFKEWTMGRWVDCTLPNPYTKEVFGDFVLSGDGVSYVRAESVVTFKCGDVVEVSDTKDDDDWQKMVFVAEHAKKYIVVGDDDFEEGIMMNSYFGAYAYKYCRAVEVELVETDVMVDGVWVRGFVKK